MSHSLGDLIGKYIALRDKANDLKKEHKEQLAPYNEAMQKLEEHFLKAMQAEELENLKTDGGTAYQAVQTSVTVADWDAFKAWIVENHAWHMLDQRANKTAVTEVLEDTGELPPGLNVKRSVKVNVRRS